MTNRTPIDQRSTKQPIKLSDKSNTKRTTIRSKRLIKHQVCERTRRQLKPSYLHTLDKMVKSRVALCGAFFGHFPCRKETSNENYDSCRVYREYSRTYCAKLLCQQYIPTAVPRILPITLQGAMLNPPAQCTSLHHGTTEGTRQTEKTTPHPLQGQN